MLSEAGYRLRGVSRELVLPDPDNGVEFFFLRPRDIAVYVGTGTVDVGLLRERQARQAIDFGVPGILDLRRARTVLR